MCELHVCFRIRATEEPRTHENSGRRQRARRYRDGPRSSGSSGLSGHSSATGPQGRHAADMLATVMVRGNIGKGRTHVLRLAKCGQIRLTTFRHARCGARRRSWSAPHRVQTKCSSRRCRRCWTSRSSRCPSASGMPSTPPSPSRAAPSRPPRRSSTRGSARRWLAQS